MPEEKCNRNQNTDKNATSEKHQGKTENISAKYCAEACYRDYQRLQDTYDKMYNKGGVLLGFIGVILTILVSSLNFKSIFAFYYDLNINWIYVLIVGIHAMSLVIIGYLLYEINEFFSGMNLMVFKSEILLEGKEHFYDWQEEDVAKWLMKQYTECNAMLREAINAKQEIFERMVTFVIYLIVLSFIIMAIEKGGFYNA